MRTEQFEPIEIETDEAIPVSPDWDEIEHLAREAKADPSRFIEDNFARLTKQDFPLYAAVNLKIPTKLGRSIPFRFNRVQRYLWRLLLQDFAAGIPVRWFIIKGRQFGCSTWILALFYWLTSLRPNRNALVVAHDEDATQNFNSKVRHSFHANAQTLLQSETTKENREEIRFGIKPTARNKGRGPGLNSGIAFETANKPSLGRSYTLQYVHLSEFALWPNFGIDLDEVLPGLYQAVPEMPGTIIIKESTAKGENEAKKFWDDETNGYRKIFLSWLGDDSYGSPLAPGESLDLCGAEEIGGQQTRYGNELEEARLIRRELEKWYPEETRSPSGPEWLDCEVLARLKWRRDTIDKKCRGDKNLFRNEYPTTVQHAWAATSANCFDQESLELMREAVEHEALPVQRFTYRHNPDETDPNVKFASDPYGPLQVYKRPEAGQLYVIGGDTSMGMSKTADPLALIVLAVPDLEEVASFSGIITPDQFAELAYYLGKLYNTALLGIENNERGGFAANLILSKQLHYPRLYRRFDPFDKKPADKPGFITTPVNKSVMVTDLAQLIRDHEILFRSSLLHEQLAHYAVLPGDKLGATPGWHDDLVSALLIAVHLAAKVHLYPPPPAKPAKGSFAWEAERMARMERRRTPSYLR